MFLRCASFFLSAQTCVLGHTSPLEGCRFQAATVGCGLVPTLLPDLASILSWVLPASSVQWDGSASWPEGWTRRPAGTHRTVSPSLSLSLRPQVKVAQSCLTLCDPMDYTVHGILQARILEWVAYPFSSDLPDPGSKLGHCTVG